MYFALPPGLKGRITLLAVSACCTIVAFLVFGHLARSDTAWLDPFQSQPQHRPKVFVLLLDTADPRLIEKFSALGQLPNFARLRESGVSGDLRSFYQIVDGKRYTISLPIIASIFTGRPPEEHGMESHIFLPNGPSDYYPFSGAKVRPIWRILSEQNRSVGVVGTMGNFPVERGLRGYVVSGEYIIKDIALPILPDWAKLLAGSVYSDKELIAPENIQSEIDRGLLPESALKVRFEQYPFTRDFPKETERVIRERWERSIGDGREQRALRFALAFLNTPESAYLAFKNDAQAMAVARHLYQQSRPDLFVEYHQGLDFYSMMYHTDEYHALPPDENALIGYYRFFDERIGEILSEIGDDTTLIVISDHGVSDPVPAEEFHSPLTLHKPIGIFYMIGPGVSKNERVSDISVYDIAPTILYTLGLPLARDMNGWLRTELFAEEKLQHAAARQYIDSYEDLKTR